MPEDIIGTLKSPFGFMGNYKSPFPINPTSPVKRVAMPVKC